MFGIVVNTNSAYSDLWPMFFGQLSTFTRDSVYVFTDKEEGLPDWVTPVLYNPDEQFRTQYLRCLERVNEKNILYLNDDYIIYDKVNTEKLNELSSLLSDADFVRLTRGDNIGSQVSENLFELDKNQPFFYSQTASLWRIESLLDVHRLTPDSHIAGKGIQFEELANETVKKMAIKGLVYYNGEPKRGMAHYDSSIFPYIASAIVRGKWNLKEYFTELMPIFDRYRIDPNIRGVYL